MLLTHVDMTANKASDDQKSPLIPRLKDAVAGVLVLEHRSVIRIATPPGHQCIGGGRSTGSIPGYTSGAKD